ncbi:hypothetical protein CEXT_33131 [Caerostris extrusa]|uniref:Uncharacterized protein n=1 Tax=Caerostris extrusa TaxID=172846 RepID=A0AAV4W9B3_CAEEX|nr:hypothetical protein CEXT_33131 [Caerostris extrusa]
MNRLGKSLDCIKMEQHNRPTAPNIGRHWVLLNSAFNVSVCSALKRFHPPRGSDYLENKNWIVNFILKGWTGSARIQPWVERKLWRLAFLWAFKPADGKIVALLKQIVV